MYNLFDSISGCLLFQAIGLVVLVLVYGVVGLFAKCFSADGKIPILSIRVMRVLAVLFGVLAILVGLLFFCCFIKPGSDLSTDSAGNTVVVKSSSRMLLDFLPWGAIGLLSFVYGISPKRSKLWILPAATALLGLVAWVFICSNGGCDL
jgi:hypothetical protein